MPPKKARPRPITWKVTGGAHSGGLIVRGGSETKSPELEERLATKSVIQELERQGERIRYKLVSGSGPPTGWISTTFKGKDLLKKRPLKCWIVATGTRGDIQPYLALAVDMQGAGYEMDIWTCEDYRSFVEDYGIRMHSISDSVEELIKSTQNMSSKKGKDADKAEDGKKKEESDQSEKEKEMNAFSAIINSRWLLSLNYDCKSVGGISALKKLPKAVEERLNAGHLGFFYSSNAGTLALVGYTKEAEAYAKEAERIAEEEEEKKKKEGGEAAAAAPSSEAASAQPESAPQSQSAQEIEGKNPDEPDWDAIDEETTANSDSALAKIMATANWDQYPEQSYNMVKTYIGIKNYWKNTVRSGGWEGTPDLGILGIECLFMKDLIADESYLTNLLEAIKKNPPDIICYNIFWSHVGVAVEAKCSIPSVLLHLQPAGIFFGDPSAAWVTDEVWPLLQQMNPLLYQYSSLAEAREKYKVEDPPDLPSWAKAVVLEEEVLAPHTTIHPIRDMGPVEWHRRQRERSLCGFLSSIASDRFMQHMGEYSKAAVAKCTYTGFWIMSEKHQIGDSAASNMFGGPELMKRIEDFIAAGDKPAYIGWGSCVCMRGRSWMIALAVASLKEAKLRGIILGGWAELNMELLQELVGEEDSLGLVEYAKKNILFIKKAPQVWLFPKCSVVVIHGGVGTLAAAWSSGTPLIVCPVWLDQFTNQWLNTLMGAGVSVKSVDDCSAKELAHAMTVAVTDKRVIQGAQAVQFSMMMDKGIQVATECIDDILLEDVPTGRWKQWFAPS